MCRRGQLHLERCVRILEFKACRFEHRGPDAPPRRPHLLRAATAACCDACSEPMACGEPATSDAPTASRDQDCNDPTASEDPTASDDPMACGDPIAGGEPIASGDPRA